MKCPACKSPLVVVERESIELDWCIACRGLWFDEGELELLGEKAGRVFDVEDLGRRSGRVVAKSKRRCPRCPRRLEEIALPAEGGREIRILAKTGAAPDHPVIGSCLETEYLKAVWMVVD